MFVDRVSVKHYVARSTLLGGWAHSGALVSPISNNAKSPRGTPVTFDTKAKGQAVDFCLYLRGDSCASRLRSYCPNEPLEKNVPK
jgi:hypothetical protein